MQNRHWLSRPIPKSTGINSWFRYSMSRPVRPPLGELASSLNPPTHSLIRSKITGLSRLRRKQNSQRIGHKWPTLQLCVVLSPSTYVSMAFQRGNRCRSGQVSRLRIFRCIWRRKISIWEWEISWIESITRQCRCLQRLRWRRLCKQ